MDTLFMVLGAFCMLIAILGSFLPILPGPLLGYIGLLLLHFTSTRPFGWEFFLVWGVIMVAMTILDYIIPVWGTKKFGGTKRGNRWSTIGLIVAVIILPILGITIGPFGLLGLIAGPFLWAYLGEKLHGRAHQHALKAAIGSFIGFLAGMFLKIVVSIIMAINFATTLYFILRK